MAGLNDRFEVPGMEERKTASKKPVTIDKTSMERLEKALLPYGKKRPSPIYNNAGFRKWWINAEKCLIFWGINKRKWPSCGGRCIAVCPWIKPMNGFHNPVRWLAIHGPGFVKRFLVRLDEVTQHRKKSITP